jgi:hypothetical protein
MKLTGQNTSFSLFQTDKEKTFFLSPKKTESKTTFFCEVNVLESEIGALKGSVVNSHLKQTKENSCFSLP